MSDRDRTDESRRPDRGQVLEGLLQQALETLDRGEQLDLTSLCSEHPELLASVAAALGRAAELPQIHRDATRIDTAVGTVLVDRYRLEERIGAGAMGMVYRAHDLELGRAVAVKLLRPELVAGARMDDRLAREGEVLASIRHGSVVTVYDRGQADDERTFIVMELLRGVSMAQLLRGDVERVADLDGRERLTRFRQLLGDDVELADNDVRQIVAWAAAAADGLHAAHRAGVVHRDVKPSNLFVERDGRLLVLDFGIVSTASHATLGSDGSPLGTPAYMAPEQLDPDAEPNARGDVYGLGATLYHMLTGEPPFRGSVQQVLANIARREPPRADAVRPGLPADLVAIVEKAMAPEPARRYASAASMRADLLAWLDCRPVSARRASWLETGWRRARRSPQVRAAAAVLLVLSAVAAWTEGTALLAASRTRQFAREFVHVPPVLINELPRFRSTSAIRHSERVTAMLDRMVELADAPGVPLALRAIHRSDCGDFAGALADVQRIAAGGDAPFARLAAERYRRGELPDALAQGATAPEVGGPDDRFLVALHALRCADASPPWVDELLERDGGLERYFGFAEVQLVLRMNRADEQQDPRVRGRLFRELELDVGKLEAVRGTRSAITSHVLINAYLQQGRVTEARDAARRATELAPDDYVLCQLLGSAIYRSGDAEAAVPVLQRSIDLQPQSTHARRELCNVLLKLGRFEDADAVVASAPFPPTPNGARQRAMSEGLVWFARASAAFDAEHAEGASATDAAPSAQFAAKARAAFREAHAGSPEIADLPELLCDLILGDPHSATELLRLLQRRPLDAEMLAKVSWFLPESLDQDAAEAIRQLLRVQAELLGVRDG